jgi:hypothetical protein
MHTGDAGEDEDQGRKTARSEYQGFEHLLTELPQMIVPLADASVPDDANILAATAFLHKNQYELQLLIYQGPKAIQLSYC